MCKLQVSCTELNSESYYELNLLHNPGGSGRGWQGKQIQFNERKVLKQFNSEILKFCCAILVF